MPRREPLSHFFSGGVQPACSTPRAAHLPSLVLAGSILWPPKTSTSHRLRGWGSVGAWVVHSAAGLTRCIVSATAFLDLNHKTAYAAAAPGLLQGLCEGSCHALPGYDREGPHQSPRLALGTMGLDARTLVGVLQPLRAFYARYGNRSQGAASAAQCVEINRYQICSCVGTSSARKALLFSSFFGESGR